MSTKTNTVVHHEAPLPLMNYLEDALREGRVLDYDHDGEKDPAKWVKKEDKKKGVRKMDVHLHEKGLDGKTREVGKLYVARAEGGAKFGGVHPSVLMTGDDTAMVDLSDVNLKGGAFGKDACVDLMLGTAKVPRRQAGKSIPVMSEVNPLTGEISLTLPAGMPADTLGHNLGMVKVRERKTKAQARLRRKLLDRTIAKMEAEEKRVAEAHPEDVAFWEECGRKQDTLVDVANRMLVSLGMTPLTA